MRTPVIIKSNPNPGETKYTFCHRRGLAVCSLYLTGGSDCAWIANLEVEEAHRRLGIGSEMMDFTVAFAARLGARAAFLSVADPALIPFYVRAGFDVYANDGKYTLLRKQLLP